MQYEVILKNIRKHISLTKEEIYFFTSLLKHKKIKKKHFVLEAGEICQYESFVIKGCLRTYYIDKNGLDHIIQFAMEDWWTADLASFLTQTPASFYIEALEDSELFQLDTLSLEKLYSHIPAFERFFRIMLQRAFIAQQQRLICNLSKKAEEQYDFFKQKYPSLDKRIPQHYIASYLGITPEFLSKIKNKKT